MANNIGDLIAVGDCSAESIEYLSQNEICTQNGEPPAKKAKCQTAWSLLAPKMKDGLFHDVITVNNPIEPVYFWLNSYEYRKEKGIAELIQLFLDVASYQNVDVKSFLNLHEYESIIPHIESRLSYALQESGKYLLKVQNAKSSAAIEKLSNFIITLIEECHKNKILYDVHFLKMCIVVWKQMSNSRVCAIKHTGVFFAIKCQTGLINVMKHLFSKLEHVERALKDDKKASKKETYLIDRENYRHFYKTINTVFSHIYDYIFKINSTFDDSELGKMREQCVLEVAKWMTTIPERFITAHIIDFLIESLNDKVKKVRQSALEVFQTILQNLEYKPLLANYIKQITIKILERIYDVDIKIAVQAVKILTFIDEHYKPLSNSSRQKVFIKVYMFNSELAITCGALLAKHIRSASTDKIDLIIKVVNSHLISEKYADVKDKAPLLVEALIDHLPEMRKVGLYISLFEELTKRDTEGKISPILFDMFTETLLIVCFGTCSFQREGFKPREVNSEEARRVVKKLILGMPTLKKLFDKSKLLPLLKFIQKFYEEDISKRASKSI